jgi:hypothetical protein
MYRGGSMKKIITLLVLLLVPFALFASGYGFPNFISICR